MKTRLLVALLLLTSPRADAQLGYTSDVAKANVVRTITDPDHPTMTYGLDYLDRVVWVRNGETGQEKGLAYAQSGDYSKIAIDSSVSQLLFRNAGRGETLEQKGGVSWYNRYLLDAAGEPVFHSVDAGQDLSSARAAAVGLTGGMPDWLEVRFNGTRVVNRATVVALQDNYTAPVAPTATLTGANFVARAFELQYRTSAGLWKHIPGSWVTDNGKVMVSLTFTPIATSAIRLVVKDTPDQISRIVELEVLDVNGNQVARSSAGATAVASSVSAGYEPLYAIDGDRIGLRPGGWAGWRDASSAASPFPRATYSVSELGTIRTEVHQNGFAKVTREINLAPEPARVSNGSLYRYLLERTEAFGKRLDVSVYKTPDGKEIWDDHGGLQWYRYSADGKLQWITDDRGYIVYVVRDEYNRARDVYIGYRLVIRYTYEGTSTRWRNKRIIDLGRDNLVLYSRDRNQVDSHPVKPESYSEAKLQGFGTVAEWRHGDPAKAGYAVATLHGRPYALIPMNAAGNRPIARVINLFRDLDDDSSMFERVDYNDEQVLLRIQTNAEVANGQEVLAVFHTSRSRTTGSAAVAGGPGRLSTDETGSGGDDECQGCPVINGGTVTVSVVGTTPVVQQTQKPNDSGTPETGFDITAGLTEPAVRLGASPGGGGLGSEYYNYFPNMSSADRKKVEAAIEVAKEKLKKPECRALFSTMQNDSDSEEHRVNSDVDAVMREGNIFRSGTGTSACKGVNAFTNEQDSIFICPTAINSPDLALTLIHEWLHVAGLLESDFGNDRESANFTSREITDRVREACR